MDKKQKIGIIGGFSAAAIVIVALLVAIIVNLLNRNVSRTVMIYMVGADLESDNSLATDDLEGIDASAIDYEKTNVVMIAGGAERWWNDYVETDETSIYELRADGWKKVKQQKLNNMGEQTTLASFINYTTSHYETDEYDLILWDHGAAILGSEMDELYGGDLLDLSEMQEALADTKFGQGEKLEAVIFSTCLNGSLEMANAYEEYADFLVASEEVSWSYTGASDLGFINELDSDDTGKEVGEKFVQNYQEKMANLRSELGYDPEGTYSTYSVMDLAKVDELNEALEDFIGEVNVETNYNQIAQVRQDLYQYAASSGEDNYDMVDLYNLVEQLEKYAPEKAAKTLEAVEDFVNYNYATDARSRGVSVYFPFNGDDDIKEELLSNYAEISKNTNYNDFITRMNSAQVAGRSDTQSYARMPKAKMRNDSEADFSLELDDAQVENFAKADFVVLRSLSEEDKEISGEYNSFLPIYYGLNAELDGNTLKASISGRQLLGRISSEDDFDTFYAKESENTDDYIDYEITGVASVWVPGSSAIGVNWQTESAKLSVRLDKNTGEVSIGKMWIINGTDEYLANNILLNLGQVGDFRVVNTARQYIDDDGDFNYESNEGKVWYETLFYDKANSKYDENGDYTGNGITGLEFKVADGLEEGYDYYCAFRIYDVYGNWSYSKMAKISK